MRIPANLDPAHSVTGNHRLRYHCPSVDMIDRHLRWLARRLKLFTDPRTVEQIRSDIDTLLARRLYLTMIGEGEP